MIPDLKSKEFEKHSVADYIASIVTRLPEDLSRALTLHFLEGLPQAEVAKREGVSVGAIKTRIHRAKKAFRSISTQVS